nr:FecR domain-containing protein [uncultured Brevundimonas sp.]
MDRAPLSEEEAVALEAWLAEDTRRLGALMRARALFSRTETAWSLEPLFNPRDFRTPRATPSRRRVLGWGGAIAASAGAVAVGYGLTASTAYATARGEVRQVPLADGSSLTLNTRSEVRIRNGLGVNTATHDIRLVAGEVLLTLAAGQGRNALLKVGKWRLEATDGSFFVSALAGQPPQVTAHRGTMTVMGPGAGGGLRLDAGHRLTLSPAADLARAIQTVLPDQLGRQLAWREGQLAFHDESLDQAVATFARYSRQPIIIRDPALADESVSGLFAANDPAGFAQAIGVAFGVEVRVEPDRILIG